MGIAPSSQTLPVMSCEDLAALAEQNSKTEIATIVRENELDGNFLKDELDDEILAELAPQKVQRRKLKLALEQLREHFAKKNEGVVPVSSGAAAAKEKLESSLAAAEKAVADKQREVDILRGEVEAGKKKITELTARCDDAEARTTNPGQELAEAPAAAAVVQQQLSEEEQQEVDEELLTAADNGDEEGVRDLLARRANPNGAKNVR